MPSHHGYLRISNLRQTDAGDGLRYWSADVKGHGASMSFCDRFGAWMTGDFASGEMQEASREVATELQNAVIRERRKRVKA